jgi:hypothetical protein
MAKRRGVVDEPGPSVGETTGNGLDQAGENLEQRVHRLEDAVAALQDTHTMEERITERILGRVAGPAGNETTGIFDADQHPHQPASPDTHTPEPSPVTPPAATGPNQQPWVILGTLREIRTTFRMFFDHRYRASWSAYFALMILAYVLVSQWLWSLWGVIPFIGLLAGPMHVTFIGTILDKAVDLVLALYAFKVLHRELLRYREVSAVYPPYQYH